MAQTTKPEVSVMVDVIVPLLSLALVIVSGVVTWYVFTSTEPRAGWCMVALTAMLIIFPVSDASRLYHKFKS